MSDSAALEIKFRGPGITRKQHLRFSVRGGLEGDVLRPYEFIGWGMKSLSLDTEAIEGYEIESEVNVAAGCFFVATAAGLAAIAAVALATSSNVLFWAVVTVLGIGGAAQILAATWWAEMKIRRAGTRTPLIVPVAGYSKKSVATFMESVMQAVESAAGQAN